LSRAEMIVYEAKHPYTIEGIEVYAKVDGNEIEVLRSRFGQSECI